MLPTTNVLNKLFTNSLHLTQAIQFWKEHGAMLEFLATDQPELLAQIRLGRNLNIAPETFSL